MEIRDHIAALRREGDALAAAAERAGLDAAVPTCPGWTVADLLRHTGGVHRWATDIVRRARPTPPDAAEEERLMFAPGDDAALLDWFRAGHDALVETLETAPTDLHCWSFLPAPSPVAFWARRQAHETGIHRADAESALGVPAPFDPPFAADGIDELLTGFVVRPKTRLTADPQRTLHVHCTDTAGEWLVRIGPDGVTTSREHAKGDCAVRGPASELHMLLWNRRGAEGLEVHGDAGLLELWRTSVHIRWS